MTGWRAVLGNALIRAGSRLTNAKNSNSPAVSQATTPIQSADVAASSPDTVKLVSASSDVLSVEHKDLAHEQVRQLIKKSLEEPTPQEFVDFLNFSRQFRRLAVWNARMAYIQRPGARAIASEYEWKSVGRYVLPDAVPIIILWPFSPVRFVYELADTGPPLDRENLNDPFAAVGTFQPGSLQTLVSMLKKQKSFRVDVEARRQGFSYAGSAAAQGALSLGDAAGNSLDQSDTIKGFALENVTQREPEHNTKITKYRVTINDRLSPTERFVTLSHELGHIFCGHLGGCTSTSKNSDESGWPDRKSIGKDAREIEAEAVAFLVATRAGVVTRSAAYLKSYAERAKMADVDVDTVVRAASRIERLAKIHYGTMLFKAPN